MIKEIVEKKGFFHSLTFCRLWQLRKFITKDYKYKTPRGIFGENSEHKPSLAIATNGGVCPAYAGHTPKAFQIVQKYKFNFTNQVFGVLFFQRVQVPYERIENPNR